MTGAAPIGLYTSPHLVHMRERIRVNGNPATEEDWLAAAREVIPHGLELDPRPTFFELTTAMAFSCSAGTFEPGQ